MTTQAADEPRFRVPHTRPGQILESLTPLEVREHLEGLQSVTEAVLAHLTLPELYREMLSRLRSVLSVDEATVLLCTEGGSTLVVKASKGLEEEVEQHVEIPIGQGIAGAVAARRQAVIVDDVSQFETVSPFLRRLASMMVAPLIAGGDLLGILHVGTLSPRHFTARDLYLLQVVADRVALAIRNALTYDRQMEAVQRHAEAEAALRESEARWRTLAEVDPNGILVMDDRSVILAVNPAVERILGYAPDELIGQSLEILIPERFREAHRVGIQRYLATGNRNIPWTGVELPALARSGREIPVEIAFGEYLEGGRHVFAGFIQDLSARKREEARRNAEHGVTRVLATAAAPEEVPPRVVAAICEALGWDLGTFWTVHGAEQRIRCETVWHRGGASLDRFAEASRSTALQRGEGLPGRVWHDETALWIDDVLREQNFPRVQAAAAVGLHAAFAVPVALGGEVIGVIELFAREVETPDGELLRTMEVIGHDVGQYLRRRTAERDRDQALAEAIEAREQAEEHAAHLEELQAELEMANGELQEANENLLARTREAESARAAAEEANRAKAEFLAAVSHELRTPLNAVIGYADLIQAGVPDTVPPGALRQVERILLASRHLLSLIEEILSFTRLEADREQVRSEPFDACTVVEVVRAILEPLAAGKGLQLRTIVPPGPLPMTSDVSKVRQILISLLDNAVKFTEEGGIDFLAWTDEGDVYFRVRDTGPGIAHEHRQRIFEPFWQADQSSTRTVGGLGLGLAVAGRLARALRGEITVESEPGRGATFTVRFPRSLPRSDEPGDPS
ncbi:MAG: GAF domain-containing protein [Gemmatimonadota bacterium]|nr:GAF domain-containing protein [Gemmatimonadota bacterium]